MNSAIHAVGPLHAAGLWIALCVLLLLVLSALTSVHRRKHKVSVGDGGNVQMAFASRAFGNAAEYTPIALVAFVGLALVGYPAWAIHALGAAFFLGRVLHAWGMFSTRESGAPTPGRMFGMLLTYIPLLASAVMLIWSWIAGL